MAEVMIMKKSIPSSAQYEPEKGLYKEIQHRQKGKTSQAALDLKRKDYAITKIQKTKEPGPASYETIPAIERNVLRKSINNKLNKEKKETFMSK